MVTTARLLSWLTSPGSASACISMTVGPARVIGISMCCSGPTGTLSTRGGSPSRRIVSRAEAAGFLDAEILDRHAQGDGLADDAVARRLDDPQAAIGFLPAGGDQHVERGAAGRAPARCRAPGRR